MQITCNRQNSPNESTSDKCDSIKGDCPFLIYDNKGPSPPAWGGDSPDRKVRRNVSKGSKDLRLKIFFFWGGGSIMHQILNTTFLDANFTEYILNALKNILRSQTHKIIPITLGIFSAQRLMHIN